MLSALQLTPLDEVKVVILGQDPYINPGQAHGLAFSVQEGTAMPPSLANMAKEIAEDVGYMPNPRGGGCLDSWARQGVLLLNTTLTVQQGASNSHAKRGWESFTSAVVAAVSEQREGVVWLAWGKPAQLCVKGVSRARHCVLEAPHPSPLSAYRGFFGSRHFSQTNDFLKSKGQRSIDWRFGVGAGAGAAPTPTRAQA